MSTHYDAIVIGGGPAGAMTALLLGRRGWRTALVERHPRYRRKACGHWLHPRALGVLERAGVLDAVRAGAAGVVRSIAVEAPGRPPVETLRTDGALVVERHRFDQTLIDAAAAAGADVYQPAAARVTGAGTVRVGADRLRADLVVGADGIRSAVARAAGLGGRRAGRKYGFALDVTAPPEWDAGRLHMFVVDHGYLGVVGARGALHLGGLVSATAPRRDPVAFVRDVARRFPALRRCGLDDLTEDTARDVVAAGPMPSAGRRVAGGGTALVGDAAGYVEPFTGEGMRWALESATLLDGAIGFGAWSPRAVRAYARAWRRGVAPGHRRCRWLARALERRATRRGLLSVAGCRPVRGRTVAEHVMMTA